MMHKRQVFAMVGFKQQEELLLDPPNPMALYAFWFPMKIVKTINNFSDGSGKRREWEQVLGKQILDETLQEQRNL